MGLFPHSTPPAFRAGHTAVMAIRFTVQGDDERECAEGLALLQSLGLQPSMLPRLLTDNRWMARAVPTTKAPTVTDDGRGSVIAG